MKDQSDKDFFKSVYEVVRMVPVGRVTTYGAIASYLGTKGAARMVGWAMNASHAVTPPVPAHRVVNRNGLLSGKHHFDTPNLMQKLLEHEGVQVIEDQIVEFKRLFWDPAVEIEEL